MSSCLHVFVSSCLHVFMSSCLHVFVSSCLRVFLSSCLLLDHARLHGVGNARNTHATRVTLHERPKGGRGERGAAEKGLTFLNKELNEEYPDHFWAAKPRFRLNARSPKSGPKPVEKVPSWPTCYFCGREKIKASFSRNGVELRSG